MVNQQRAFRALGSEIILTLVGDDASAVKGVFDDLEAYTHDFEERFSRFRDSSELTKVNQAAGQRVIVSDAFGDLVETTIGLSKTTDGLFNPFILPKLQEAGYKGSWPTSHQQGMAPQYDRRRVVDAREIKLGQGWIEIPAETALDFGGIGKGYLLARLAELVPKAMTGYWFSLGGDIAMAGRDAEGAPWKIAVAHALLESKTVGSFSNDRGWSMAVATSGVTKRKGITNGKAWHHIIDPRTGKPAATDLLTVTVCHDDPTQADVLAKSAVIIGSADAWEFLEKAGARGAILQQMGDNDEVIITHYGDVQ